MIKKNILITGGAGFIASNFIEYFINKYEEYFILNLDLLTYAGNLDNLKEVQNNNRYKFIKGNICNRELIEFIFEEYNITDVIHFAAESHVDNSIKTPDIFIKTNINGTFNLLDLSYKYWLDGPFKYKDTYKFSRFHHISTDEVYGTLGETGYFTEETPYSPNSPYSSSKASSDMLVRSYHHTYGLNTVITNCSNNYGPKQHDEKLIPTIIRNALEGNNIPIYGDGKNIRDWLYVIDHCNAIDKVFHNGKNGETYNVGGNNEKTNIEIAKLICKILDDIYPISENRNFTKKNFKSYEELITFVEDRPGHDRRYAIDSKKLQKELKWFPNTDFESNIKITIEWYLKKYLSKKKIL